MSDSIVPPGEPFSSTSSTAGASQQRKKMKDYIVGPASELPTPSISSATSHRDAGKLLVADMLGDGGDMLASTKDTVGLAKELAAGSESAHSLDGHGHTLVRRDTTSAGRGLDDGHSDAGSDSNSSIAKSSVAIIEDAATEHNPDEEEEQEHWKIKLKNREPILEYKELDFEHFKNRYGEDDGRHLIEILRATPTISHDIENERNLRLLKRRSPAQEGPPESIANSWWQRVRINSWPVLGHLHSVTGTEAAWPKNTSRTFFRPFNVLTYFQQRMREVLQEMEGKWAEVERLDASGEKEKAAAMEAELRKIHEKEKVERVPEGGDEKSGAPAKAAVTDPSLVGITALRHLRFYVDFVDKKIMPLLDLYQGTSKTTIRFNDIGLLLRPGDIVYAPPSGSSVVMSQRNYQTAWRVYHAWRSAVDSGEPDDIDFGHGDRVKVCCYHIDYNGESYGLVKAKFKIKMFQGEKKITDLPIYPIRFADNAAKIEESLRHQGESFTSIVKEKHLYYEGWTIPSDVSNKEDKVKKTSSNAEHIESAVILDFGEAYKHHEDWKPKIVDIGRRIYDWEGGSDSFQLAHWADRSREKLWYAVPEKTQPKDDTHIRTKYDYVDHLDKFILATRAGDVKELTDPEDIMLLPRRLVAYALRERRFVQVDVLSLRQLPRQNRPFRDLKINPDHKRMVRSLVKAHFRNREMQRQRPFFGGLNQDLIQGKGSGLFILLHGLPGVGKTATAEAIALSNNKPLFTITCGDLGFTPKDVETELKEIFRLAHLWDCVLLLDEADIFLARRDMANLKRNALVSVFLRVLEYYSGILFLTTNRVGILDEAFKSRIHISLYYERLTLDRTLAIFEVNIRRLKSIEKEKSKQLEGSSLQEPALRIDADKIMDFAERHYEETPEGARWNGRQIRNAFQIASSLARYDVRKSNLEASDGEDKGGTLKGGETRNPQPSLSDKQFQLVAEAIERFDNYFQLATGTTDESLARMEGVREDGARHEDLAQAHHYYGRPSQNPSTPSGSGGRYRSRGDFDHGDVRPPRSSTKQRESEDSGRVPVSASRKNSGKQLVSSTSGLGSRKGTGVASSSRDTPSSSSRQQLQAAAPLARRPRRKYVSGDEDDDDDDDEDCDSEDEHQAQRARKQEMDEALRAKPSRRRYREEDEDDEDQDDDDF